MKTIQMQVTFTLDAGFEAALSEIVQKAVNVAVGFDPQREARLRASHHANLAGQKMPEDKGLLIDTKAATKLLNVSARTIWQMTQTGRIPQPIKIGRLVRWSYEELQAWVNAGGPPMSEWKWPR